MSSRSSFDSSDIKKGDVLITDGVTIELSGHAAIAISDDEIIHLSGRSNEPGITSMSMSDFINRYDSQEFIKVYRYEDNQSIAEDAADIADILYSYLGETVEYSIFGGDLSELDPSYCSKFVLQCYHLADENSVNSTLQNALEKETSGTTIIHPYLLNDILNGGHYDIDLVGYLHQD